MTKKTKTANRRPASPNTTRPAATEAQPAGNKRQRVMVLGANFKVRWEWREREL